MNKIVIATFEGLRKDIQNNNEIIKVELSDFKYDGNKVIPDHYESYIRAIKVLATETDGVKEYDSLKYIIINADTKVVQELMSLKIPVIFAVPEKSINIADCIFDGQTGIRLSRIKEYYDSCLKWMREIDLPILYIHRPLKEILNRDSTYNYLNNLYENVQTYRFGSEIWIEDLDEIPDEDQKKGYKLVDVTPSNWNPTPLL